MNMRQQPNRDTVYGVEGMLEFDARIEHGGVVFRIPFRGGSFSGYGNRPATFSTSDPLLKLVIEKSALFKSGRILPIKTDLR